MFTGLVEAMAPVVDLRQEGAGRRLAIDMGDLAKTVALGDSVAIDGCCLTVVSLDERTAQFEAGPETLAKTTLGELRIGDRVNMERAMALGDRLGGHFVQGHVDGVGTIRERTRAGEWETVWFAAGPLARQLVPKGSVAVDGISLTVVEVAPEAFSVALIPHTLEATTLGTKGVGSKVNLEADILGKYVLAFLGRIGEGLSLDRLRQAGFLA